MRIKEILYIFISILCISASAQTTRGVLLSDSFSHSANQFYVGNQINLLELRTLTNFLTNRDITTYKELEIPKRKKAFLRHVKQVSEQLEKSYVDGEKRSLSTDDKIYELVLLSNSLKQKTIQRAQLKVPIKKKIEMLYHTSKSRRTFKYKIPTATKPTYFISPQSSPYFHETDSGIPMHKQFVNLAKQKNIKIKDNLVVLFKDLSLSGSAPKVNTYDLDLDNQWVLKWGDEVHTDVVGSRIFAALGFDVDHPYYFGKNKLTLIFDNNSESLSKDEMIRRIGEIYHVDLLPFISSAGTITAEMAKSNSDLEPFIGKEYLRFLKCFVEARPDRVKRIGSFLPNDEINVNRKELKGAILAHHFIGNWDTREANTLLTTVHNGNYHYRISAVFSDLGTCLGVSRNNIPPDFKVGLVNELPWKAVKKKGNKIVFSNRVNSILPSYKNAKYEDLLWMANKIAELDGYNLQKIIDKAHWPKPIAQLYFHKLASRRASILNAFDIADPNPIEFDQTINITHKGVEVVKNGVLVVDYKSKNPESFISKKGRLRNYGN